MSKEVETRAISFLDRLKNIPKSREALTWDVDEWAAGFFEVAGWWGYINCKQARKDHTVTYTKPCIKLTLNSPSEIIRIEDLLAPQYRYSDKRGKKSYTLVWDGCKAVNIARRIRPFAPYRRDVILSFMEWDEASTEERYQITTAYRSKPEPMNTIQWEEYHQLMHQPVFLAGIVDARGNLYEVKDNRYNPQGYTHDMLRIQSTNLPLLTALHQTYFGSQPIHIKGKSFQWSLYEIDLSHFLNIVGPFVRLKSIDEDPKIPNQAHE